MFGPALRPVLVAVKNRSLVYGFVQREVRGRFAGSFAGMGWALLNPLATLLAYMFVFSIVIRIGVTKEETGTDSFFIYFATGFIPWLIFSDSLVRATGTLLDNAPIVTKVIFPVELLPLSSVLSGLVVNGFGLIALIGYLGYQGQGFGSPVWLMLICLLPVQIVFTLGLGLFFSAVCVFLRDIREMLGLLLMVWFFSTPIVYPISMVPESIQGLIRLNPMYIFVELYRSILIRNSFDLISFAAISCVAGAIYVIGSLFFARVKPGFGDVL